MQYYVDKNSLDYFVYGGTSSASFNFIITENDHLNSFENDFELIEIPGRSGDLLINNNRKKNKEINIEAYVDLDELQGTKEEIILNIRKWLQGEVKYNKLMFSDTSILYEAIILGNVEIVEEMEGLLNIKFKFSCKEVIK